MKLPKRLVVVGAGLLGGSVLASLQARRGGMRLVAVSSGRTLEGLRSRDWCDELHEYEGLSEACDEADLVLLCSPMSAIHAHLETVAAARDRLAPRALVMDVGSTKFRICRMGFERFPDEGQDSPRFVGAHPMAGSEKSGLAAADPLLFQSALWVLCPPKDMAPSRLDPAKALILALGARGAILDPEQHDACVARISHVPQIVSTALSAWAGSDERLSQAALALAAGGFRDMTRLALSSWEVWRDILATNPGPIASGLRETALLLSGLADHAESWARAEDALASRDGEAVRRYLEAIQAGDALRESQLFPEEPELGEEVVASEKAFRSVFAQGKAFREKFRMPRKGIAHDLSEFVVRLEDRPGQMLALLSPLAEAGINVQDLEILKVREGETGTVLLGFGSPEDRERAREVLGEDRFLVMDR
jgi:prephenate dehydrogenase